jgi:hypothetical protein
MADPRTPLLDVLDAAEPRPGETSKQSDKKNYAERLSRQIATMVANSLRGAFPGITPSPDGKLQEAPARAARKPKKLDVNYSTSELGLGLGVSIKTINVRDPKTKRYTKNYTRVDNELRAEATDFHVRQPYAVLVAAVFVPIDACDDGGKLHPSSFGQAIQIFRYRSGRAKTVNDVQLFERLFIGLYQHEAPHRGEVAFFDVMQPPPRQGRPRRERLLTYDEFIDAIKATYDARNDPPFLWDE